VEGENHNGSFTSLHCNVFGIIASGTSAVGASAGMRSATGNGDVLEITDLQPFTHVAYVPTGFGSVFHQD